LRNLARQTLDYLEKGKYTNRGYDIVRKRATHVLELRRGWLKTQNLKMEITFLTDFSQYY